MEHEYCELLSEYGKEKEISAALLETESGNMADLGYGCKAFTISLVENAVKVSKGQGFCLCDCSDYRSGKESAAS